MMQARADYLDELLVAANKAAFEAKYIAIQAAVDKLRPHPIPEGAIPYHSTVAHKYASSAWSYVEKPNDMASYRYEDKKNLKDLSKHLKTVFQILGLPVKVSDEAGYFLAVDNLSNTERDKAISFTANMDFKKNLKELFADNWKHPPSETIFLWQLLNMVEATEKTLENMPKLKPGRPVNRYPKLVREIRDDYEAITGKKGKLSYDQYKAVPCGDFYEFVCAIFDALDIHENVESLIKPRKK